ncbi:MAG: protease modulator HflC [FCB group bacterium]|nr:protease modulator HflC [FCB group bacterium]
MKKIIIPIILVVAVIILGGSIFTLNEAEQAIVTQFGKPVGQSYKTAGIHFKLPLIQEVLVFEKRILEWDGDANEIPTKDNKYIFIDTFARWKISDPLEFFKSARNEMLAQSRLDDIIDGAVRDEIASRVMAEIIRFTDRGMQIHDIETSDETMTNEDSQETSPQYAGARLEIVDSILEKVSSNLKELDMGITVIDIQLKRINYNKQVQQKLFNRMISEQSRIAEKYRAQGQGKKQEILGMQIQRKKEIMSDAYVKSQQIKGDADAEALKIYAETYGQDVDFYNFLKALETYENTLDPSTRLILSTDNRYLKYLE